MVDRKDVRFAAKLSLVLGALFALPAAWSLFSAIYSAVNTGEVMVISLGRYGTHATAREMVAWPHGWSRFVGPVLLAAALWMWAGSGQSSRTWWIPALLSALGLVLLLFSKWFATWNGFLGFVGLCAFVSVALYVGNKLGRLAAYGFVLLSFSALLIFSLRGT